MPGDGGDRVGLQRRRRRDEARGEDGLDDVEARRPADRVSGRDGRLSAPLSVRTIWGVGPRAAEALEARAVRTIDDVRRAPHHVLARALGESGARRVAELALGDDPREVQTERVEKSISHEETFAEDVRDADALRAELLRLADRVAVRLRRAGMEAAGAAIKVRFADFTTITRSQALAEPTDLGQRLGESARELFAAVERHDPVRLIGVRAERLQPAGRRHWRCGTRIRTGAAPRVTRRCRRALRGGGARRARPSSGEGRCMRRHDRRRRRTEASRTSVRANLGDPE